MREKTPIGGKFRQFSYWIALLVQKGSYFRCEGVYVNLHGYTVSPDCISRAIISRMTNFWTFPVTVIGNS